MSDYQNFDLRSAQGRRADGTSLRGILITLAVVIFLFLLLAVLGTVTRGGDRTVPAGELGQTAPAAAQLEEPGPAATAPAAE